MNNETHVVAPSLAIVVPCYNEEDVLPESVAVLSSLLNRLVESKKINESSKIYFVDDGSADRTWTMLEEYAHSNKSIVGIKLSRNKGHQNALFAGLMATTEDAVVSIDADLQDDPNHIEAMVDEFHKGNDVVYGVRSSRESDSFFKRFTAEKYYRLMQWMGVDLVFNHADFRLLSRVALEALKEYEEVQLFLRGIIREIGLKSSCVEYIRQERHAGESKYPLKKMLSFAWEGISSLSSVPLRAITILGFASGWLSLVTLFWVLGIRTFTNDAIPGWASILLPLLFIGSVQLMCLGIIGEYLAKIFLEVKKRPKFHIEKQVGGDKPH